MAERSLRILQVSTADIRGGAEKVAWDLFTSYRARGHCSWLAVGEKRSNDPDVLRIPNQESRSKWYHFLQRISHRLARLEDGIRVDTPLSRLFGGFSEPIRRLDYHLGLEDFHFPGTSRLLALASQRPDVFHGHNLHGDYFDLRMLPILSQQLPVVLTLHDAWMFSGHCAHSFDCERWKTGCGDCPDLTIYPEIQRDATHQNWRRKREIYQRSKLYIATPSRWLMQKVERSMLAPAVMEGRILPNGVDRKLFHPADQQSIRAELGIDPETRVLLAMGIKLRENIWKDFATLQEAFLHLAGKMVGQNLLLIALGDEGLPQQFGQAEIRFIPFQESPSRVARFYQAADIYIHTSRADTFPVGVLEAMSCGTPVIANAVGGIPEQIEDGIQGFLVPPGDVQGLTASIYELLTYPELRKELGKRADERAVREFNLEKQVDAYLDWYIELVWRKKK